MMGAGTGDMRPPRRSSFVPALAIGIAAVLGVAIVSVTAGRLVAFQLWPTADSRAAAQALVVQDGGAPFERQPPAAAGGSGGPAPPVALGDSLRSRAAGDRGQSSALSLDPPPPPPLPTPPPPDPDGDRAPDAPGDESPAAADGLADAASDTVGQTFRGGDGRLGPVASTIMQTSEALESGIEDAGQALGDLLGGSGR